MSLGWWAGPYDFGTSWVYHYSGVQVFVFSPLCCICSKPSVRCLYGNVLLGSWIMLKL